jgi:HPt (histidine-containing phosphotransfer) domain-containing protein
VKPLTETQVLGLQALEEDQANALKCYHAFRGSLATWVLPALGSWGLPVLCCLEDVQNTCRELKKHTLFMELQKSKEKYKLEMILLIKVHLFRD